MLLVAWHQSGRKTTRSVSTDRVETVKDECLFSLAHPIGGPFTDHSYRYTIVDTLYADSHRIVWDTDKVRGII